MPLLAARSLHEADRSARFLLSPVAPVSPMALSMPDHTVLAAACSLAAAESWRAVAVASASETRVRP